MIESTVTKDAAAGPASGFFTEGVAHYTKQVMIPADWSNEEVYLKFDDVMMNATVDVNGGKAVLQHNGYIPFSVNITPYTYFGRENNVTVTVNPSMQPNSRWYSGAGIFRSVELIHVPKLHIADDGIYGYTKNIEYNADGSAAFAYLHTEVEVQNETPENKMALVEVFLTKDGSDEVLLSRTQKMQVNPNTTDTLVTTGVPAKLVLRPEETVIHADGHSLSYVAVEVADENGLVVPDAAVKLHAEVEGAGKLDAFGSSNPITEENYTAGEFTSYQGRATAIIRGGYEAGSCTLTVSADGFETVTAVIEIK